MIDYSNAKNVIISREDPVTCTKVCGLCETSGNSISDVSTPKKKIAASKRWGLTLNNYSEEEVCAICAIVKTECRFAVIAKETGEKGTPHLQGYFEFKIRKRPIGVFNNKRIRFDKKTKSRQSNVNYCSKEVPPFFVWPSPYMQEIAQLYDWEKDILSILGKPVDDRAIYWYWERIGNTGKTTFLKYIYTRYKDCVILSGKANDMKNGIVTYYNTKLSLPRIVLIDIPRSCAQYVSIPGIEEIKNMFFYSGKYEGGMVCGPPPHVIVMANIPPNIESMSRDRWNIVCISDEEESSDDEESCFSPLMDRENISYINYR